VVSASLAHRVPEARDDADRPVDHALKIAVRHQGGTEMRVRVPPRVSDSIYSRTYSRDATWILKCAFESRDTYPIYPYRYPPTYPPILGGCRIFECAFESRLLMLCCRRVSAIGTPASRSQKVMRAERTASCRPESQRLRRDVGASRGRTAQAFDSAVARARYGRSESILDLLPVRSKPLRPNCWTPLSLRRAR
jgi:hypothetical protein